MNWIFDDGGRADAGYKGQTGDCVVRAIAIATGKPYQHVYDLINRIGKWEQKHLRAHESKNRGARHGIRKDSIRTLLERAGWHWTPTMQIGSGCKVHLRADELPKGKLIVQCSGHLVAVIDGIIHDIYDPSREGTRCVYGYWGKDSSEPLEPEKDRPE